jgi:hypothetical protein
MIHWRLLPILSLLLCIVTGGLWMVSYSRYDGITRSSRGPGEERSVGIQSNAGEWAGTIKASRPP